MSQRSWVEIRLDVLFNNVGIYKNHIIQKSIIMAVVKADAYDPYPKTRQIHIRIVG